MVGCTIPFCNNCSEKGYIIKRIPKEEKRRGLWINSIKAKYKWTPSENSGVCEMHFQPEMWEQRKDNKRKLRHNAIPTIFEYFLKKNNPVKQEIGEEQQSVQKNEKHISIVNEKQVVQKNDSFEATTSVSVEPTTSITERTTVSTICALSTTDSDANERAITKLEARNKKLELDLILFRKQVKNLRLRVHTLENNIKNDKYKKMLNALLNEDQIQVLTKKTLSMTSKKRRARRWSNATIERALKLRLTCGVSGYEQLLQDKWPLPSLRTLQRNLQDLKFKSGNENGKPELYTTAWFIESISKWFSSMTSRSCCIALGIKNIGIYKANIACLHEVTDLFTKIQISHKAIFKPVQ